MYNAKGAKIETAQEALEALDEFFMSASAYQGEQLWDVLSALRGPDNDDGALKQRTTCVVRAVALPGVARLIGARKSDGDAAASLDGVALFAASGVTTERIEAHGDAELWHFFHHIIKAQRALERIENARKYHKIARPFHNETTSPDDTPSPR